MKKYFILILSTFLAFQAIETNLQAQVSDSEGIFYANDVQDDTVIVTTVDLYKHRSFTTCKGFYFIEFNNLQSNDGVVYFGMLFNINDTVQFVPFSEGITLNKTTDPVTVGGKEIYLYHDVGGVRRWQIMAIFDMFPGDYPAIQYIKNTADAGSFEYRVKAVNW